MKTIPSEKSNRCWTVAEIPQAHADDLSELEIYVNYTEPGNAAKGCALDGFIVPMLRLAPRLLEVVARRVAHDLATMGLTRAEIAEVRRLVAYLPGQRRVTVSRALFQSIVESLERAHADSAALFLDAADMQELKACPMAFDVQQFEQRYRRYVADGRSILITPEPSPS